MRERGVLFSIKLNSKKYERIISYIYIGNIVGICK